MIASLIVKQNSKIKSLGVPGNGESIVIQLNRGNNTNKIVLLKFEKLKIIGRFLFTETKEKENRLGFAVLPVISKWETLSKILTNEEVATFIALKQTNHLKINYWSNNLKGV